MHIIAKIRKEVKVKVGFVSLGCSKNLIDTEIAIGHFKNNNYEIENNPEKADIIVINTCGFIASAKEEAINTILEMAEYKKTGKCKVLIATGCLVERYKEDLVDVTVIVHRRRLFKSHSCPISFFQLQISKSHVQISILRQGILHSSHLTQCSSCFRVDPRIEETHS